MLSSVLASPTALCFQRQRPGESGGALEDLLKEWGSREDVWIWDQICLKFCLSTWRPRVKRAEFDP